MLKPADTNSLTPDEQKKDNKNINDITSIMDESEKSRAYASERMQRLCVSKDESSSPVTTTE